jgi:hypothetical protein
MCMHPMTLVFYVNSTITNIHSHIFCNHVMKSILLIHMFDQITNIQLSFVPHN